MAYANLDDVKAILPVGEEIPAEAEDLVGVLLEEATDLVVAYLDRGWEGDDLDTDGVPDDVPGAVRRVVARVVLRGFLDEPGNPGSESEVELMGPFSHTINWMKEAQARSAFLTDAEKMRLDPYKLFPATGAAHMPMAGACGTGWFQPYA